MQTEIKISIIVAVFCIAVSLYSLIGYMRIRNKMRKFYALGKEGVLFTEGFLTGIKQLLNVAIRNDRKIGHIDPFVRSELCILANGLDICKESKVTFHVDMKNKMAAIQHNDDKSELIGYSCMNCYNDFGLKDIKRYPEKEGAIECPHCKSPKTYKI